MARAADIWIKRANKKAASSLDFKLLLTVAAILAAGLISLFSAVNSPQHKVFFYKQLAAVGLGSVGAAVIYLASEKALKSLSWAVYALAILLLILTFFIGKTVSGTKGWLAFGGASFQPAEFAKFAALLFSASILSRKGTNVRLWKDFFKITAVFFVPAAAILAQPDVGSATVFIVAYFAILYWANFDAYPIFSALYAPVIFIISFLGEAYFIAGTVLFVVLSFFFKAKPGKILAFALIIFAIGYFREPIFEKLPRNTKNRIEIYLNPSKDPLGYGYNVIQSVMAVGGGGLTGKGYMKGSQTQLRYIPEQRTDFIFCVPAEEFGFIGSAFIFSLYVYLILRIIKLASLAPDSFYSSFAFGFAAILAYHVFVNIGMVLRLTPVMGLPLPFASYGGTAMVVNLSSVGVLLNLYKQRQSKIAFDK